MPWLCHNYVIIMVYCGTSATNPFGKTPFGSPQCWESTGPGMSGWRIAVGSLLEMFWPMKPTKGHNSPVYVWETEGYGCIEFEISNSSVSTVFRQPLRGSRVQIFFLGSDSFGGEIHPFQIRIRLHQTLWNPDS